MFSGRFEDEIDGKGHQAWSGFQLCCFGGLWGNSELTPARRVTPPSAFTSRKLTPAKRGSPARLTGNPPSWGTPFLMWGRSRVKTETVWEIGYPTKAGYLTFPGSPPLPKFWRRTDFLPNDFPPKFHSSKFLFSLLNYPVSDYLEEADLSKG